MSSVPVQLKCLGYFTDQVPYVVHVKVCPYIFCDYCFYCADIGLIGQMYCIIFEYTEIL